MGSASLTNADALRWDVGNWNAALEFWQRYGGINGERLDCLEIGAYQGGLSVWLASFGHHVVCSDIHGCEAFARPLVEEHGVADRITFEDIDATAIPYENRFDVIVFKSVLVSVGQVEGIERQRRAVQSMYRALKPGGRLFFAENLKGSRIHRLLRSAFVTWGKTARYVTIEEMLGFLTDFSDVKFSTTGMLGAFGRSESQRRFLAALDRAALNAIVPPSWHYIIYGVARK